jgi:hypothetical protein
MHYYCYYYYYYYYYYIGGRATPTPSQLITSEPI